MLFRSSRTEAGNDVEARVRGGTLRGEFSVLAGNHLNEGCACSSGQEHNNLYATAYCEVCIQSKLRPRRPMTDGFPTPTEAINKDTMLNASIVFYGEVIEGGIATRHAMARDSLADLRRQEARPHKPIGAEVNLPQQPQIMLGTVANLNRPEFNAKVKRLTEHYGATAALGEPETRFHRMEKQQICVDLKIRGFRNFRGADRAMNNSVFACPYFGLRMCIFCTEKLIAQSEACLIKHMIHKHARLIKSWWTCPTCLIVMVVCFDDFEAHWLLFHAPGTGLQVCLDETNVQARYDWGQAILSWITVMKSFTEEALNIKYSLAPDWEPESQVNYLGGYLPLTQEGGKDFLLAEVEARRYALLPEPERSQLKETAKRQEAEKKAEQARKEQMKKPAPVASKIGRAHV